MEHACVAIAGEDDKAIYISGGREHLGSQGIWTTLRTSFRTLILKHSSSCSKFRTFWSQSLKFLKKVSICNICESEASNVYFQIKSNLNFQIPNNPKWGRIPIFVIKFNFVKNSHIQKYAIQGSKINEIFEFSC